jgi:hypothetical protein
MLRGPKIRGGLTQAVINNQLVSAKIVIENCTTLFAAFADDHCDKGKCDPRESSQASPR